VQPRVRVAAVNDYELVVEGVAQMLSRHGDRIEVVEQILIGDPVERTVDVALYDTYGRIGVVGPALEALIAEPRVRHVAMFSLDLGPTAIAEGRAAGATGFISKALPALAIVDAIERVARGEDVVVTSPSRTPSADLDWPGRDDGLTERESQVIVLAAEGLTNREIGLALYLSPETIKGYLRQAYRKLDLHHRVDAAHYVARSGAFARHRPPPHPGP
jgi:DNA-binding NarL/FixJ family response regulator